MLNDLMHRVGGVRRRVMIGAVGLGTALLILVVSTASRPRPPGYRR